MVGGDPAGRRASPTPREPAPAAPGRRHQHPGRRSSLIAALLASLAFAAEARADELDDFVNARDAYINGDYPRSTRELRALVERADSPQLALVRPVARKYLAASLLAEQHEPEARAVIAALLREDPGARLDPVSFEDRFVRLYDDVVRAMQPELARLVAQRAEARRRDANEREARRALALQLISTEARVQIVPRWMAFVPFGVGQFSNRQNGLGALFLSLEATFLAGSVATAAADRAAQSPTQRPGVYEMGVDDQRANLAFAMRVLNWSLLSAFVVTAAIGVWRANVDYVPLRVLDRVPRPLPRAFRGLQFSARPGGMDASLRVTF